jgi:UDPglucose 6-dehydrogenase
VETPKGGLVGPISSIAIIGSGYVGTVVGACFANVGREVIGVEINQEKLNKLRMGVAPFYEPGLDERLRDAVESGRLTFTDDIEHAMERCDLVFLCVDTPAGDNGDPNVESVAAAARAIGRAMYKPHVLVTKSTVPIGSGNWLATTVENELPDGVDPSVISVVSNPEFLREGSAVKDFLHPDRIVLGGDDQDAVQAVADAYQPILDQSFSGGDISHRPVLVKTDRSTAETIKYAANSFLATKISFINEIAEVCEWVGADVNQVAFAIGLDPRIGAQFLRAGVGWGGSCFAKDVKALAATARSHGQDPLILDAAARVNENQRHRVVHKLQHHLRPLRGSRVALLGLAFKPGTDDIRDAPAITIAESLIEKGVIVRAFDPIVKTLPGIPSLQSAPDPYAALDRADAVVLVTEWPELTSLDFREVAARMRGRLVLDARNCFDPEIVRSAGLVYEGMGRAASPGTVFDQ